MSILFSILDAAAKIFGLQITKDTKIYTEPQLARFAKRALIYSLFMPAAAFPYAHKAKKSVDPEIVREAVRAERTASAVYLILILFFIFLIGSLE